MAATLLCECTKFKDLFHKSLSAGEENGEGLKQKE